MAGGAARYWAVAVAVGWWAIAAPAAELPRLPGMTQRGVQRFAEAANLEAQKRWPEAVEAYLRIVDDAGDDLVPSDDPRLVLPARRVVHRRLASRPDLLGPYRERVEGRARQLLDRGRADRDPQPLDELLDQFFCSRSAEAALHLLGDLACERGDFDAARTYWELLLPATGREFTYPDPKGDPAFVRAKLVLARLLAGEREQAVIEFRALRKAHPKAEGYLAGRQGPLVATLQGLFDAADVAVRRPSSGPLHPPTTFAADTGRTGLVAGLLPPEAPRSRYDPIALPDTPSLPAAGRVTQVPLVRTHDLAFHPVVAFGHVLVADARRISAYDLATGRLAPGQFDLVQTRVRMRRSDPNKPGDGGRGDATRSDRHDARYTLTVDGDRVYARLGFPDISSEQDVAASYLVCLPWQATPDGGRFGKWRWLLPAMKDDTDPVTFFEGSPLVQNGRLYVGLTRFENNRATTAVACYDADDPRSGPIWQQDVGESGPVSGRRYRAHLLTLAQGMVVCSTNAGAVVALDAGTGRRIWAVRYESRGALTRSGEPSPRDLTPAVAAGGRILVAPADYDRVLGLDGRTGTILWESAAMEVAHLLGVAHDWLVCQLGGYVSGLTALDVATGRPAAWGYQRTGAESETPFGRGFLVQDRVVWPTRSTGVQQMQWNGDLIRQPVTFMRLPGGNLAYGDGCLVVATADRLHILLAAPPDAKAAEARKPTDAATWLWEAERRRRTNRPAADVRAAYQAAADWARERLPAERLDALVRLAEYESAGGRLPEAVRAWRAVLEADDLRYRSVLDATGRWRSVRTWAIRELDQLRTDGANFTDLERAAAAESDLSRRADRYPNATATRTDLLVAAQKAEKAGRATEAVTRYRQLLGCLTAEDDKPVRAAIEKLALADAAVPPSDGRDEPPKVNSSNQLAPAWRVRVAGPDQWAVLPEGMSPTADVLYVAGPGRIAARALPDGRVLWQRDLLFTPDWVAPLADSVLLAGADGAARLAASDGRVIWQLRVPESAAGFGAPSGWRDSETPVAAAGLSGFRVAGGRLFARVVAGLIAIDTETGQVAWQWRGSSRSPGGNNAFSPHYHADPATIVLQNDGRRYLLDAASGQTRATGPAPADPWPSAPADLDPRRVAVAEDGRVVAIDKSSGAVAWTYELTDWPSLTAEPVQLRADGSTLLVGVPRNDGFEIVRLDSATGKPREKPAVASHGRIDLGATAVIDGLLYFADGGLLTRLDPRLVRRQFPRLLDAGGPTRLSPTSWRADRIGSYGLLLCPSGLRSNGDAEPGEPLLRRGQLWVVGAQGEVTFEPIPFDDAGPHAAVRAGLDGFVLATAAEVVGYRFTKREGR